MLRFILKMLIQLLSFDGSLSCIAKISDNKKSLNNWSCQVRWTLFDVNPNEYLYYAFLVSINRLVEVEYYWEFVCPIKVENKNNKNSKVFNLI